MTTQNTTSTATATATDFELLDGTLSVSATRPLITVRRGEVIVITRAVGAMLGDKLSHFQLA